jgi:diguanylate cyclase (GGDEF)-like protein/PAS domain S-box-containing protein
MNNILMIPSIADLPNLLEICIEHLNDAILITEAEPINSPGPRIVWANKAFYQLTGYTPDEIIGQSPRILQGPESDRAAIDKIRVALEKWQSIRVELLNYRKDGSTYWNEFEIVPVANVKGWYTHWVSVQRDITERKQIQQQINQLAFYDMLTKLPNRYLLSDRLTQATSTSKRNGLYGALLFLDLDDFKPLNDQYGHAAGDLLLVEAANRMTACVREMDTVARFGGDEFVIVLCELDENKDAAKVRASIVAEKICTTLAKPYLLKLHTEENQDNIIEHHCTASIGVTLFIADQASEKDIFKWADDAMYEAKEAGRNLVRFYEATA